jgi:AmmeMemoRadiSam system protein B
MEQLISGVFAAPTVEPLPIFVFWKYQGIQVTKIISGVTNGGTQHRGMLGIWSFSMLARLRPTLDFMPSPVPDKPGLLIRDPFQFSDAALVIPPVLVESLTYFDGTRSSLDLREHLVRLTGDLDVGGLEQHLIDTLSGAGFLEDDNFFRRKEEAERAFAAAPTREPAHAGTGYPEDPAELTLTLRGYLNGHREQSADAQGGRVRAIAAPHVSPYGGVDAYRAAYASLAPSDADRTFVVLGTSHYGEPDRFGLTRKAFATPLGETSTNLALVDEIARAAGDGALMEDYCHAVEHSIEFQVVFLQHLFGANVRVAPVLCGAFSRGMQAGAHPEDDEAVRRTIGALGEIAAREGDRLLWVLGVDMAHMGRRYGDRFEAIADRGEMEEVAGRDRSRIERMEQGDAAGFWAQVRENRDDLKWCGASPIYTFLRALPGVRGSLLRYQQWNIDPHSVVSFAGLRFHS